MSYVGDSSQHTGFYAFDEIDALNILLVPGVTTAPVIAGGIAYAESRKDLLFIAEPPIHLEPLEVIDFRKGQGSYTHAAFNSSYAALYYPWLEISDPLTGKSKLVPPTGAVAGCIARSDQKTDVWYAPAGIDRGRIFNVLSLAYKTSRGERDVLYSEGINVIASVPRHRHQHLGTEDSAGSAFGARPHQRAPPDDVCRGGDLAVVAIRGLRAEQLSDLAGAGAARSPRSCRTSRARAGSTTSASSATRRPTPRR